MTTPVEVVQVCFPDVAGSGIEAVHRALGGELSKTMHFFTGLGRQSRRPDCLKPLSSDAVFLGPEAPLLATEGPVWRDGGCLELLPDSGGLRCFAVFERTFPASREVVVRCTVACRETIEGFGLVFLNADAPADALTSLGRLDFEEPNVAGSLSVGFDLLNPPSASGNAFDADGNIHNRMQCEVSLHVDGRERANRAAPRNLQNVGRPFEIEVALHFVPAGCLVSVTVDGHWAYSEYLAALAKPCSWRLALGARRMPFHHYREGKPPMLQVRGVSVLAAVPEALPCGILVPIFSREPVDGSHREVRTTLADVPPPPLLGSAVLEYRMELPQPKNDGWDRCASVLLQLPGGSKIEIARLITPYKREWTWYFNVTDFLPLFRNGATCFLFIDSWLTPGFLITLDLHIFPPELPQASLPPPMEAALVPLRVDALWQQAQPFNITYGDPKVDLATLLTPQELMAPGGSKAARAVVTVTGHGFGDTSCNGAEFMPLVTTLRFAGAQLGRRVWWRDDCYLNPCRPQGGTWKFDRAGWAPGDAVDSWVVTLPGNGVGTLEMEFAPYRNAGSARAYVWVHGCVVWLGSAEAAAALETAVAPGDVIAGSAAHV